MLPRAERGREDVQMRRDFRWAFVTRFLMMFGNALMLLFLFYFLQDGLGLGRDLVADALANAQTGASVLGARALVAEAIDADAERFYARLGLWQSKVRPDLFAVKLGR